MLRVHGFQFSLIRPIRACLRICLWVCLLMLMASQICGDENKSNPYKYSWFNKWFDVQLYENYEDQGLAIKLTRNYYQGRPHSPFDYIACDIEYADSAVYMYPRAAHSHRRSWGTTIGPVTGTCFITPPGDTFNIYIADSLDTAAIGVRIFPDSLRFTAREEDSCFLRLSTTTVKRLEPGLFWFVVGNFELGRDLPDYMNYLIDGLATINAEFITIKAGDYGFFKATTDPYSFNHIRYGARSRPALFFRYSCSRETVAKKWQYLQEKRGDRKYRGQLFFKPGSPYYFSKE